MIDDSVEEGKEWSWDREYKDRRANYYRRSSWAEAWAWFLVGLALAGVAVLAWHLG